jgi:hypothetical protein
MTHLCHRRSNSVMHTVPIKDVVLLNRSGVILGTEREVHEAA